MAEEELGPPVAQALELAAVAAVAEEQTAVQQAGYSGPSYCRWPGADSDSDSVVCYILKRQRLELN